MEYLGKSDKNLEVVTTVNAPEARAMCEIEGEKGGTRLKTGEVWQGRYVRREASRKVRHLAKDQRHKQDGRDISLTHPIRTRGFGARSASQTGETPLWQWSLLLLWRRFHLPQVCTWWRFTHLCPPVHSDGSCAWHV